MKMMVLVEEMDSEELKIIKKLNTIQKYLNKLKGKEVQSKYLTSDSIGKAIIIDIVILAKSRRSFFNGELIIYILYDGSILALKNLKDKLENYFSPQTILTCNNPNQAYEYFKQIDSEYYLRPQNHKI